MKGGRYSRHKLIKITLTKATDPLQLQLQEGEAKQEQEQQPAFNDGLSGKMCCIPASSELLIVRRLSF